MKTIHLFDTAVQAKDCMYDFTQVCCMLFETHTKDFRCTPHQNATWHVNALKKLPYVSTRERLHMSVLYSSLIVPLHTLHYGKQDKDNFILAWWPIQLIGCIPEGHCIKY